MELWDDIVERAPTASPQQLDEFMRGLRIPDRERKVTWLEELVEHPWWYLGEDDEPQPYLQLVRCLETGAGEISRMSRTSAWQYEGFPNVVRLELVGIADAGRLRRALWRLPNLLELDLSRTQFDRPASELLAGLVPLRHIELKFAGPPEWALEGLRHSEAARELRHLDLSGNWHVGQQIDHLAVLPLRSLILAGNHIEESALDRLAHGPMGRTLEHLDLRGVARQSPLSTLLNGFTNLRTLVLTPGTSTSDIGEGIEVDFGPPPSNVLDHRELPASVVSMVREGWSGRRLPWVDDPSCWWWDDELHIDPRLIDGTAQPEAIAVSVDGALELARMSSGLLDRVRRWVMLSANDLGQIDRAAMAMPRLETLDLSHCMVPSIGKLLGQLPGVATLILRGGSIDVRMIEALGRSKAAVTVRCLVVSGTRWSRAALQRLELHDCVFDHDALEALKGQRIGLAVIVDEQSATLAK